MKMLNYNKWKDSTHNTPQSQGTDSWTNASNSSSDCVTMSDTPKNMIMKSRQDPVKGQIRTRS